MPEISIYTLEYAVCPKTDVKIVYWAGAILRNNLLYAAASIYVDEFHTLLDLIQETDHLLPRGYSLQCEPLLSKTVWNEGNPLRFKIQLFGRFSTFADYFHSAVMAMCRRGIGTPMTSLSLLSCRHYRMEFPRMSLSSGDWLEIDYVTPVSIYNSRSMPQSRRTSLDMQNGMPGLYFLIRSLVRRINKLHYAYEGGTLWTDEQVDEWCMEARSAQLEKCSLRRIVLQGPPRQSSARPIYFKGYIGHAVYSGVDARYLPLLQIGMETNVGNDTVYGMGQYNVMNVPNEFSK